MKNLLLSGRAFLSRKQGSILSAAFLVMGLIALSRILGLIRQRVLAHFFSVEDLAVYFASFRLPETLFEVLVSGSLASAFIPVFTRLLSAGDKRKAWYVAGLTQTTILLFFILLSLLVLIFAKPLTEILTPGFSDREQILMVNLTRFLLLAQGFFLLSFFLSGTQEAFGRFLVPSIAPLFYNLGIITGSVLLSGRGVWGAAIGAVVGAALHFLIQLPFAKELGFRFIPKVDFRDRDFRKITILALPRMVELVALQLAKSVELLLSSLISVASYTYFIFANTLQLFPVALFGYSFAKAAFPTLATHAAKKDHTAFASTFNFAVSQILFFVLPIAVFFVVLRIPLVRLAFGTERFTWESTVQTGWALSAFSLGVVAQGLLAILTRSFYALQNTKVPMMAALLTISLDILLAFSFVRFWHFEVWGIALAFSLATLVQTIILFTILERQVPVLNWSFLGNVGKIIFCTLISGGVMYFLLKVLDQAAWDKRLSFLGQFGLALPTGFQGFVIDTKYTVNLIFLTLFIITVGIFIYLLLAMILRIREVEILARWVGQLLHKEVSIATTETKEPETPAPLPPGG